MTYSHAKVQGQWSVGSEDRVETNGQTEVIALPPTLMLSVAMIMLEFFSSSSFVDITQLHYFYTESCMTDISKIPAFCVR